MKVLVTGATGYVASRLLPALIEGGFDVRATSRHPEALRDAYPDVELVASDLMEPTTLGPALEGIDVVYYLVHSMQGHDFEERDRKSAVNLLAAAEAAGVKRIIYLSGLGRRGTDLSAHLRSRHEVGDVLAGGSIPVTELRAAIIIGSGSVAFDMLRYLTERLPFMIAPRWLSTRIQPIGEGDLIRYLIAAATEPQPGGKVEIGGADVLTYRDMILRYAAAQGLRRRIVSVPVLSPRLSSYWVDLMTPVPATLARPLIDGLRNEVIVTDDGATVRYPHIVPGGYDEAVAQALKRQVDSLRQRFVDGSRSEPGSDVGFFVDEKRAAVDASPTAAAAHLFEIGGDPRWYPIRVAWWARARIDSLFGGVGLTWARPLGPLEPGAIVDWWTVEARSADALLLRSRMRTPGEAWLSFRVVPSYNGSELRQTGLFRPRGLLGRLYWWVLLPFHAPIFRLMVTRLATRMSKRSAD